MNSVAIGTSLREPLVEKAVVRPMWLVLTTVVVAAGLQLYGADTPGPTPIQYEAEGKILYAVGGGQTPRFTRDFGLTVSNCDWAIHITANDPKDIDYFDVVHQGDCIYYYTSLGKLTPQAGVANSGTAVIEHGVVPTERGDFADYVWLGLASSCYFRASVERQIQPIWIARDVRNTKVKGDWELSDAPPFLPKQVVYYQSPGLLPAPFDHGWRAAQLHVTSETNIGAWRIPLVYTYEQLRPKADGRTADDVEVQFRVTVTVDSVRLEQTSPIGPPTTRGTTVVEERRFSTMPPDLTGVQYASTNRRLPRMPEAAAVEQHKRILAASGAPGTARAEDFKSGRRVRIIILILLSLSAGVFALVAMKNKNKQTMN
jgi:hypothetical protein